MSKSEVTAKSCKNKNTKEKVQKHKKTECMKMAAPITKQPEVGAGSTTKDFYTVKEIAEKSGLSYGTIKRAIDGGTLPAYRIGRKYFIAKEAGEAFCKVNYSNQNVEGYTIQEIMEKNPLSYAFLMELVKNKKLPTTKKGRQYIVTYEDYETFIRDSMIKKEGGKE